MALHWFALNRMAPFRVTTAVPPRLAFTVVRPLYEPGHGLWLWGARKTPPGSCL